MRFRVLRRFALSPGPLWHPGEVIGDGPLRAAGVNCFALVATGVLEHVDDAVVAAPAQPDQDKMVCGPGVKKKGTHRRR